jgi:hypothetical protein
MPATCCAAVATAGHAVAGGGLPRPGPAVVFTLLLAAAGVAAAGRRRGPVWLLGTVALTQLALHLLLAALADGHHGTAGDPAAGTAAAPGDPAMIAWHTVAALITAALLARAEAAVFGAHAARGAAGVMHRTAARLTDRTRPAFRLAALPAAGPVTGRPGGGPAPGPTHAPAGTPDTGLVVVTGVAARRGPPGS